MIHKLSGITSSQVERSSKEPQKGKDFHRQDKEIHKQKCLSGLGNLPIGEGRVCVSDYLIFLWWWGFRKNYLIGADQKIPHWPVRIAFLGKVVTAIKVMN